MFAEPANRIPAGSGSTPVLRLPFRKAAWILAGLWIGCASSPETLRAKLDKIGREDLQGILDELSPKAKNAVLTKPYFLVDEFKEFHGDTARVFQAYASLIFFYLDPSYDLCQVRKYRYRRAAREWDRYDVKLKHIPAKYGAPPGG